MRALYFVFLAAWVLLANGCATGGGKTLKIDIRDVPAVQSMPNEVTSMLQELGYRWISIVDPETHLSVKAVQRFGEHRMRFELIETGQVRIDVRIRIQDGFTWLHFYEPESRTLSPSSKRLLELLKKRAQREFGPANVRS